MRAGMTPGDAVGIMQAKAPGTKRIALPGAPAKNKTAEKKAPAKGKAKGAKKKIYFITGHGELLPSDTEGRGFSQAKEALEASRYTVAALVLVEKDNVPVDDDMLIFVDE